MQRDGIDDVDLQVDFATARMIVENKESPLIIEGRMAAVMASYAIEHLRFPDPIHRVYLQCDEREVCLRMAEREAGLEAKEWMREVCGQRGMVKKTSSPSSLRGRTVTIRS